MGSWFAGPQNCLCYLLSMAGELPPLPRAPRRRVLFVLGALALLALLPVAGILSVDLGGRRTLALLLVLGGAGALWSWRLPARHATKTKRLWLLVLVCGLCVSLCDGFLRVILRSQLDYRAHEALWAPWPPLPRVYRYRPLSHWEGESHGDLAALLGPSAPRELRHLRCEVDALGFRNSPEAKGPYRLLLLGDSFGLGSGTSQERTAASLLGADTKLYNLSMVGSPWHQFMNLRATLPSLETTPQARLVWLIFPGNDLDEQYGSFDPVEPLEVEGAASALRTGTRRFARRSPLRNMLLRSARPPGVDLRSSPAGEVLFFRTYVQRARRSEETLRAHKNFSVFRQALQEVKALVEPRGLKILIVAVPPKAEVHGDLLEPSARARQDLSETSPFARVLRSICVAEGFGFLDLGPAFVAEARRRSAAKAGLLYWRDDTHWNEVGHAFAAQQIRGALGD